MPIIDCSSFDKNGLLEKISTIHRKSKAPQFKLSLSSAHMTLSRNEVGMLIEKISHSTFDDLIALQGSTVVRIDCVSRKKCCHQKQAYFFSELHKIEPKKTDVSVMVVVDITRPGCGMGQVELVNMLAGRGYKVTMLTISDVSPELFYEFHPNVTHVILDNTPLINASSTSFPMFMSAIMKYSPSVVISFRSSLRYELLSLLKSMGIATIVAYRGGLCLKEELSRPSVLKAFKIADVISLMLPAYRDILPKDLRYKVSFNPIVLKMPLLEKPYKSKERKAILYVGRLEPDKNVQLLIKAFNEIGQKIKNLHLDIVGDGSERERLMNMVHPLLKERVIFHGRQDELSVYYANASVFVLPSYSEGISNALLEARSAALPVICFSGIPGNEYLVTSMKNGILMSRSSNEKENLQLMLRAIEQFFTNTVFRAQLEEASLDREALVDCFSMTNVLHSWEDAVEKALRSSFKGESHAVSAISNIENVTFNAASPMSSCWLFIQKLKVLLRKIIFKWRVIKDKCIKAA